LSPSNSDHASNADFGQRDLFIAFLKGRAAIYAYVLGGSAAFVAGAWQRSPAFMAAGPAAVVVLVILVAAVKANRLAAERFYAHFATSLGLTCWPRFELLPLTPLLGAGDRRWCEHWMAGTLRGEPPLAGGLGHFVFEELEHSGDHPGVQLTRVTERRRFTLCAIDLEPSLPFFKGLYVRPCRGLFPEGADWVRHSDSRVLEFESALFAQRYEVRIASDQSEVMARQLLSPTLVEWLAQHPLAPCFEAKAGTLAVYLARPVDDAGNLTFFLDAARHLAVRVLRETDEALARPAA
jgi:hypothetical protein